MGPYLLGRLLQMVPVLLMVSAVTFTLVNLLPGDIVVTRLGENATPQDVEKLRSQMGLDRPLPLRYVDWVKGIATGDPGRTVQAGKGGAPCADLARRFSGAGHGLTGNRPAGRNTSTAAIRM